MDLLIAIAQVAGTRKNFVSLVLQLFLPVTDDANAEAQAPLHLQSPRRLGYEPRRSYYLSISMFNV